MRIIAHLDLDAFFAAVEERERPWLAGKPIVVGADLKGGKGRGVVSTANYKAREFGIHSAMPISSAWRLAEEARKRGEPETVFLRGSWRRYSGVSAHVMEILRTHSPIVEVASVDEAYFDLSYTGSYKKAESVAQKIKREIHKKEYITASVGIGPNKLIAKLASGRDKPDGLTTVQHRVLDKFLEPLSVRKIPGVGPKAEETLAQKGVRTVKDAKHLSKTELAEMFGVWGNRLYEKLRGIDESPLITEREIKSIGEQKTFMEDTLNSEIIVGALQKMCERVAEETKKKGFSEFRAVTITVRFADFTTKTRAHTSKKPLSSPRELFIEAMRLLTPFFDRRENPKKGLVRLVGVRVAKLT